MVHLYNTHTPYAPAPRYRELYCDPAYEGPITEFRSWEREAIERGEYDPTDADVAIMASNLPQYSRAIIAEVVQRVHDALLPGGEFHLIGETINAEGTGPLAPALWGLSEAVSHSTGLAHSDVECVGYLEAAGFRDVSINEFIPQTLTRISGYKPD